MRKKIAIILACIMMTGSFPIISHGASYTDVPTWASNAVKRVSDDGYMVGSSNGKFNPYTKVSYFKLVDILAGLAGYRDPLMHKDLELKEKYYIENAYKLNKWVTDFYGNKYDTWRSTQNKEITYLLQKGILDQSDLDLFIKKTGSIELERNVTKEVLSKYLVRMLDLEDEALYQSSATGFKDNNDINELYRPYVKLLKDKEIISGSSDNKYNPKEEVSKVIMAVLINNYLEFSDKQSQGGSIVKEVTGKVVEITDYSSIRALRISVVDTSTELYQVDKNVKIYGSNGYEINEKLSNVVSKGNIIKVAVDSDNTIVSIKLDPYGTGYNNNNNSNNNNSGNNGGTVVVPSQPSTNIVYDEITGVFNKVESTSQGYKVYLNIQYVTWGQVKEQSKLYELDSNATITLDGETIRVTDIEKDSIVIAKVNNGTIYSADVQTKDHKVEGTILKRYVNGNKSLLRIESKNGQVRDYVITSDTKIHKAGVKNPTFSSLNVGNEINLTAEFDVVEELYCSTEYQTYTGLVEMLEISTEPKISIRLGDGVSKKFLINDKATYVDDNNNMVDQYELRLGYKVEVDVDNEELLNLEIKDRYSKSTFEGTIALIPEEEKKIIVTVKSDSITDKYYNKTIDISNARVYKGSGYTSRKNLKEDMKILITLDKGNTKKASVIYIIQD